jgi:hypothetical protein
MSIRSYLEPRASGAWLFTMPAAGPIPGQGTAVQGPVLEGRMRLDEALVLDQIRAICGNKNNAGKKARDEVDRDGSHPGASAGVNS